LRLWSLDRQAAVAIPESCRSHWLLRWHWRGREFPDRSGGKSSLETEARLTGKPEEELLKANEARIPLGRYAHPHEIANTAVFLASDCASYVTGALITMDGALTPMVV
jgi:hypothetical protein